MQYHPHGDASIGDALVVLANKRYLIEGQGNFGNIFTGDPAAAPRYIECRLTELARTELFNDEITDFVPELRRPQQGAGHAALQTAAHADARHGRHRRRLERADFAAQFPGTARSADCDSQEAAVQVPAGFPDRRLDGRARLSGRQRLGESPRPHQDARTNPPWSSRKFRRRTTTDSLIASIEDAARKGKLKVKSINDFTSENVEIEIKCPSGVDAEKMVDALYAFTDCEVTIASRIMVIKDNRPVELTVSEVLRENTEQLVAILKRELELREKQLLDELHYRTLERIFIEERIYKKIEKCKTNEAVIAAVYDGFKPFKKELDARDRGRGRGETVAGAHPPHFAV